MELQQEENQNCTDDTVIFQGKGGGVWLASIKDIKTIPVVCEAL